MTASAIHLDCFVGNTLMEHFNDWEEAGKIESIVIKNGVVTIVTEDGKQHFFYEEGLEITPSGVTLPGDRPHMGMIALP